MQRGTWRRRAALWTAMTAVAVAKPTLAVAGSVGSSTTASARSAADPRLAAATLPEGLRFAPRIDGPISTAPKISSGELVAVGTLAAGLALTLGASAPPQTARFQGGLLFDDGVRGALRVGSPSGRARAGQVSDLLHVSMIAYPVLVDALFATALLKGEGGQALRMIADDAAAFLVTGLVVTALKNTVGRQRPYAEDCPSCVDKDSNQSFPSGHTAMAFTGAGLICSQHSALGVYGGGTLDNAACITSLALASATGALRVAADRHYTTDVLAGGAIGLASGYLIPRLMHALFDGGGDGEDGDGRPPRIVVAPQIGSDQVGLTLSIL